MLNKAIEIAARAHAGQVDKGGNPYILHPLRVMLSCYDETDRICAVLHDVVEDTTVTLEDIRQHGFSGKVVSVLDCLTKRYDESYEDFIGRILWNENACRIKLADLNDNMDLSRIGNPSAEDQQRLEKYSEAARRISESMFFSKH